MKIYFKTRDQARAFKGHSNKKVVDCDKNRSRNGSRWAVEL